MSCLIQRTQLNQRFFSIAQVPIANERVVIEKPILLNTETASLGGVTLRNGGRLVFDPEVDQVKLTSTFVLIEDGGRLEVGSATCSYDKRADIVLTGEFFFFSPMSIVTTRMTSIFET